MSYKTLTEIASFVYPETATGVAPEPPDENIPPPPPAISDADVQNRERRAMELGLREGEAQARASLEPALVQAQALAASMAGAFERERVSYFKRVEGEVVRLALAIAKKIIHREAQIDPLLLAGVVRVALEHVASGSTVKIFVHPMQIDSWREFFSVQSGLNLKVEWTGDNSLDPSQCRLETSVGSTAFNLDDQLNEISRGFFDLLAEAPDQQPA